MISKDKIENFNKKFDVVSVFIEHEGEILLVHRQDHKPQGNTWAVVAGKVDGDEDLHNALIRELQEEIDLKITRDDLKYFDKYYVRYTEYDFIYHIFHLPLSEKPILNLKQDELKNFQWINPKEALNLNLIQDEDACIKWFYNI